MNDYDRYLEAERERRAAVEDIALQAMQLILEAVPAGEYNISISRHTFEGLAQRYQTFCADTKRFNEARRRLIQIPQDTQRNIPIDIHLIVTPLTAYRFSGLSPHLTWPRRLRLLVEMIEQEEVSLGSSEAT